jgi:hypothetical protein
VGFGFVVLLLVSAGMASVPTRSDSAEIVRGYYTEHTAIVVVAQLIGLGAAVAFGVFAQRTGLGNRTSRAEAGGRGNRSGGGRGLHRDPTVVVVRRCWQASNATLDTLVVASDVTDVALFVAIAAFASCVALTGATWLCVLALVTALVSLVHAVLLIADASPLEAVAPLAFITLVLALSVVALREPARTV